MRFHFGRRRFLGLSLCGATVAAYAAIFDSTPHLIRRGLMSSIYVGGEFHNAYALPEMNFFSGIKTMWRAFTEKSTESVPNGSVEIQPLTAGELHQAPDLSLWRLGHSTVLMKLEGKFWLTDPVFVERASPLSFAGPKRFHAPTIAPEDLPEIEAVILSHDHYDHLDHDTVRTIEPKVRHFLAPLGVGERLLAWGIPASKVQQFDWWEETQIGAVKLVATPAQHFSGRSLTDRNSTLWTSWVVIAPNARLFFSGDSGYFDGFKTIGERFGPFELVLLENGAYNTAWPDIHMQPEQTAQAHIDLRGKQLVPIHNGTFDLSIHAWTEPLERISEIARQRGISLSTPRMGERLDMLHPSPGMAWWRTAETKLQASLSTPSQDSVHDHGDDIP